MVTEQLSAFDSAVEAVRIGTAAAFDKKAAAAWRSKRGQLRRRTTRKPSGPGLAGAQLEQAIMAIKLRDPGLVALPGEAARRLGGPGDG